MQKPDTYIKPAYPREGYPAHKDGAIALWEEAAEAGADALQEGLIKESVTLSIAGQKIETPGYHVVLIPKEK